MEDHLLLPRADSGTVRKARPEDAAGIVRLLAGYAETGVLLPRSLEEILESIRDFFVFKNKTSDAEILACAALRIYDDELGEVRSIAVAPSLLRQGVGRRVLQACEKDAEAYGVQKVFALTYVPEFFEQNGYTRIMKEDLPQKIWRDCFKCKLFPNCREIAVIKTLGDTSTQNA